MKKQNLISTVIIILLFNSHFSEAKKHRINFLSNYNSLTSLYGDNYGGIPSNPVYKTIDDAQADTVNVLSHDTLYLEGIPAGPDYTNVKLLRPFVIIRAGYFLNQNYHVSADMYDSRIGFIAIHVTASGSQLIGIKFTANGVVLENNVTDVTVKRCFFSQASAISFGYGMSDIEILQNFFENMNTANASLVFSGGGGIGGVFKINHNIFQKSLFVGVSTTNYPATECINNVFDYTSATGSPIIKMDCPAFYNNIVKTTNYTVNVNGNVSYNTGASNAQFTNGVNNNNVLTAANFSNLFVSGSTTDGNYQINTTSIYNHLGNDGTQRGAFGGTVPGQRYTLSGLAPIPVIYEIQSTWQATQQSGLPVEIKTRTLQ